MRPFCILCTCCKITKSESKWSFWPWWRTQGAGFAFRHETPRVRSC
jgi:hypothetical protein